MRALVFLLGQIVFFTSYVHCYTTGCGLMGLQPYRTNNGKRQLADFSTSYFPSSFAASTTGLGTAYPATFLPFTSNNAAYKRAALATTGFDRFPEFEQFAKTYKGFNLDLFDFDKSHLHQASTITPARREVLSPAIKQEPLKYLPEDNTREYSNPLALSSISGDYENEPYKQQETKHKHKHQHKHEQEHKHKHGEEHKHQHKHEEKHEHGHKEHGEHKHEHKDVEHHHHEHKHIQHHHHLHKHMDAHKHHHKDEHKHEHKHKEEHKHEEKHAHKHHEDHHHKHHEGHEHKHEEHHQEHKHAPTKEEYYYKYLGKRTGDLDGERSQQYYVANSDLIHEPTNQEEIVSPTVSGLNLRSPQLFQPIGFESVITGI